MKRTLLAIAISAISAGLAGHALAQDTDNDLNGNAAVGDEQASERQDAEGQSAQDLEQETDNGEASEADVSVSEKELPDEGDDAEDYEELMDDDASNNDQAPSGAEANAETNGEDNGEVSSGADAGGEQEGDSGPDVNGDTQMQTDPGEQATSTEPAAEQAEQAPEGEHTPQGGQAAERDTQAGFEEMGPTGASLDPSVASLQVSDVIGMTIVNQEGETLGQADNVLRHNDAGDLHAVVSVGGFWGFGSSEVALPLTDMQLEGEQLVLQDIIGEDELDGLATDYDEDRYSEVDQDMTLSDAVGQ